jgi:hypothetical protein
MAYTFKNNDTVVVPSGFEFNLKKIFQTVLRSNEKHCKNPKFIIPTAEFMVNTFQANMASFNGEYKISPEDKALLVQFLADHIPDWADEVFG